MSFATATAFPVLLVTLHVIKPEIDPSWRPASEYAIGQYGWVMSLAIVSMAISCVALFAAIRNQIAALGGRIGLGLLLVVAAALAVAGVFVVDPITTPPEEMTIHGMLHGAAGMIFIPGLPVAGLLISRSLARRPEWQVGIRPVRWTAHLMWISVVLMAIQLIAVLSSGGRFGPGSTNGWLNRLVVLSYAAWLMTVSWRAMQLASAGMLNARTADS